MRHYVFVPYSRSFDGRAADTKKLLGDDVEIIPMVLEDEDGPEGHDKQVRVSRTGSWSLSFQAEEGSLYTVVANGGPTPLCVAAVLMAQRLGCPLLDVQRDGICELVT